MTQTTHNPAARAPRRFPTELYLVTAPDDAALPPAIDALLAAVDTHPHVPERDVAWSLARGFDPARACLAVVADSFGDLAAKLRKARERLAGGDCERIHSKDGIYYFRERLGRDGGLAFLFPGEGAQYHHMLRDLCLHFPEVREAFEEVDAACGEEGAGPPSRSVFPPPGSEADTHQDLYTWDVAVMIVLAANTGMMRLLGNLGIKPRATLGHSFGEMSALEMGGIIRGGTAAERIESMRAAFRQIRETACLPDIPSACLLTVGGAERETIDRVVARHADAVQISMENCPHQVILCITGTKKDAVAATVADALTAEGAICVPLAFDRPYHTPHLLSAADIERSFYISADLHPPQIDVYSCCSADRYPADKAGMIDLATRHWSHPVRFQQTVEAMVAQGIRIFVEVGPRGNLCAFIDDILRGRPHLAVPADREQGSSLTQLQHALGQLAAHGVALDLHRLHRDRGSRAVDPAVWDFPVDDSARRTVPVGLSWQMVSAADYVKQYGSLDRAGSAGRAAASAPTGPDTRDEIMRTYLDTMDRFIDMQQTILRMASGTPPAGPASGPQPEYVRSGIPS
jgi:acyl transferase domain-containing protein